MNEHAYNKKNRKNRCPWIRKDILLNSLRFSPQNLKHNENATKWLSLNMTIFFSCSEGFFRRQDTM
jgi:hypothetical protein